MAMPTYNRQMAWYRVLLTLAFLTATLLGSFTFASASSAKMGNNMELMAGMPKQGSMPGNCNPCHKTGDAMLSCVPACGVSAVPVTGETSLRIVSEALVFDYPGNQDIDGAKFSPEPPPPKSIILT